MARVEFASGEATVCPLCHTWEGFERVWRSRSEKKHRKVLGKEDRMNIRRSCRPIALPDIQSRGLCSKFLAMPRPPMHPPAARRGHWLRMPRTDRENEGLTSIRRLDRDSSRQRGDAMETLNDSIVSVSGNRHY